jgi:NAD(P)H-hydrate repair Nnr-like enzyme with NAD(P)H-hydrate dehydratase domain
MQISLQHSQLLKRAAKKSPFSFPLAKARRQKIQKEKKEKRKKERKMAKDQYLAGQVAIVTGSSKLSGIGAATAIALAEHGANVPHLASPSKSSFADRAD